MRVRVLEGVERFEVLLRQPAIRGQAQLFEGLAPTGGSNQTSKQNEQQRDTDAEPSQDPVEEVAHPRSFRYAVVGSKPSAWKARF